MDNQNQQDPLGILGGQPKKVEQPDPLGILKKKASETALKTGGKAGTSVLPSGLTPSKIEVKEYKEPVVGEDTMLTRKMERAQKQPIASTEVRLPAAPKAVAAERGMQRAIEPMVEKTEEIDETKGFFNAIDRGALQGQLADMMALGQMPKREDLKEIARINKQMASIPSTGAYERFNSAPDFKSSVKEFIKNPLEITSQLIGESLTAQLRHGYSRAMAGAGTGAALGSVVPGIGTAAGAGTGFVAGMGVAGYNLEMASSIMDSFREAGVDITDEKSLQKAFDDPATLKKARDFANKRAVPITLFDMFSMGMGGKLLGKPAKTMLGKIGRAAGEVGVQTGLAGAGETTAQVVSGQKINPTAIFAEMIGEVGGGAPDIVVGTVIEKKKAGQPIKKDVVQLDIKPEELQDMLDISEAAGEITDVQAEEIKQEFDKIQKVKQAVPEQYRKNADIVEALEQKRELEAQKQGLDPVFARKIDEQIKALDTKIDNTIAAGEVAPEVPAAPVKEVPPISKKGMADVGGLKTPDVSQVPAAPETPFFGEIISDTVNGITYDGRELNVNPETGDLLPFGKGFAFGDVSKKSFRNTGFRNVLKDVLNKYKVVYTLTGASEDVIKVAKKLIGDDVKVKEFEQNGKKYYALIDAKYDAELAALGVREVKPEAAPEVPIAPAQAPVIEGKVEAGEVVPEVAPQVPAAPETKTQIYEFNGKRYEVTDSYVAEVETGNLLPVNQISKIRSEGKLIGEAAPQVPAAAEIPSILEVKSPKEIKQGDTVVWRGEDFIVDEVNPKGGFNLRNVKDASNTVKDARITDVEFEGKRGEVVPELPTTQLKPKEYAIQEQAAGEVPVQPEARVSEEVEGGVPPTEPPKAPEEGKAEGEEREMTGISNEEALKMRLAMELPVFEKPETETWDQLNEQADEEIRKGYNIEKLLEKLEKGTLPTSLEEVILAKYGATLANKFETTQDEQALKDYERLTNITNKIGTITARALNVRKFLAPKEDTLADFFVLEKEETGVDELTEEQKATLIKEYNEIKAATEALQKKVEQLQEENARMLAGEVVTEERKKAKKTRKTSQDFAQERKQIVDDIRQKLKEARQQSKVAVVPYLNELIAISPDVAKLVKSLVEQGVIKLEDIVTEIHATLKEDIEGLTKKDVTDLIAGEYNRKKPTRGAIAEKIKDLKDEAKLITKLEKLQEAPLPKDPIKKIERSREIKQLKDKIKEHPNTKLSEAKTKIATQIKKLEKDLADGNYDKKPEKREVPLDKEGKELQKKLIQLRRERDIRRLKNEYEKRNKLQKAVDKVTEIANIPRSLMASTDFSAPLNQAIVATIAYPDLAKKATEQMIKATASQEAFDQWFYDLKDDPRYDLMKELKLRIADPHSPFLTAREEAFMSGYAEQIPGLGRLVKASERAYVQYLNKLRVDIFNRFVDRFEEQGKTYANSPKLYEATAKYINNITGSGKLPKIGSVDFEQFSPMFSALLFSPRLMAARINMLNPYYFATLPTELKVQYGKDMGKFLGLASTIITLFALYGKTQDDDDEDKITVETDPTSTDFARIKQGDTRWDILGGFQPYIRLMNQIGSGERKSTKTGLKQSLDGEGAFGMTRGDVLASFFRNKLAPVPSMTVNFIQGRNSIGEKVTLEKELFSHIIPLSMQTIGEAIKEGGPSKVVSAGLPAVFGIGVQTYGDRPKEVKEEIEYRNREVKLTKEQKKFFQDVYDEISKKNLDKLKASREYKSVERDVQVDLENIVKKAAMKKAETRLTQKYAKEFLKFPVIQEDRKVKSIKEKVKSQF